VARAAHRIEEARVTTHDRTPPPERDPLLDAAWRGHSTELPPRAVDAAILAAAHREVASRPRTAGDDDTLAEAREPSRWWWGFAAAAAIGAIAFGLVQLAPFGPAHDPTRATDMPSEDRAARPASPQLATTAEAPARAKTEIASAPADGNVRVAERVPQPSQAPRAPVQEPTAKRTPAPAPVPPAPAPPPQAQVPALAALPRESASAPGAAPPQPFPMASPPPPAAPAPKQEGAALLARERVDQSGASRAAPAANAARAESAAPTTDTARAATAGASAEGRVAAPIAPEEFLRRIREHYDAGRLDAAARELRAFREAYADADARLPPELRAWAATLRR
jgi:hypothetical protein